MPSRQRANLHLLVAAGTISALGDGMTIVAAPLLAARLSTDPRLVSLVRVAAMLPWLTLGLSAGVIADRLARRRLMVTADLARVAVLLILAAVAGHDRSRIWPLYVLMFCAGAAQTIFDSAAQAFVADLVAEHDLEHANGLLLSGQSLAKSFLGPALGALLFAWSPAGPFLLDALSFAASASVLSMILYRRAPKSSPPPRPGLGADIARGLRYIAERPVLRIFAVLTCVLSFASGLSTGVVVLFTLDVLHMSAAGFGLLIGCESSGLLLGSLLVHRVRYRIGRGAALRMSLGWLAISPLLFGLNDVGWVALIICTLDGLNLALWTVLSTSLRLRIIPSELRGRTAAVYRLSSQGASLVGSLIGGWVAYAVSLRAPVLIGGGAACIVAALTMRRLVRLAGEPVPTA
jgi:MFS family permease